VVTMKTSNFYGILAACAAGYLGGSLSSQIPVKASPPQVVRAAKFELVDASGTPAASWEIGPHGGPHINFLCKRGVVGVDIGVFPDGRPFLIMGGHDGKRRIVMSLDQADKPMLGMGDERWESRVHLGFMPPDTIPYSGWDHWGLVFRAFGSEHPIVGMGTINTPANPAEPFLTVSGRSVR
jgi:hypothetical protein